MITVEEALKRILDPISPLSTEVISIYAADGRVLADDIQATLTHPAQDVSAMDGYALRSDDVLEGGVVLEVIGESAAGKPYSGVILKGQAVRIFTGAYVPKGADCIVMQENTDRLDEQRVKFLQPAIKNRHIRAQGLDVKAGQTVLTKGTSLNPRHIGFAANAGLGELPVYRKPKVGLLFTGSELVEPGESCGTGQIINSNGPMLMTLVARHGAIPVHLGITADRPESLLEKAEGFSDVDLCVTIGGASVGDHDLVQPILTKAGLTVDFWKIAMKPGKPLLYGEFKNKPFIGLPGNPVSAMVCAQLYLVPALQAMMGIDTHPHNMFKAQTTQPITKNGPRQDYMRGICTRSSNGFSVRPLSRQDSSMLSSLSKSNCYIVREPDAEALAIGDNVNVMLIDEF